MKQLLQNVSTGAITVDEVPSPMRTDGSLLVASRYSVISAGTERAMVELGASSLLVKARARPDLVRKVVDSARTEGVATAYAKVRGRLSEPNPLGYSLCGVVLEAGDDAPAAPGELVACAGAGHASHAEVVAVPRLLCARVPEGVPAEDAAYGTVGTVALHGVRLASIGLGDVVAVVGLGLIGQLALDLVAAAGAVPLGVDPDPARVEVAREAGFFAAADRLELESEAGRRTNGRGADAVLVTAAARSPEPIATATAVARERAVVCIVGDVAVESPRAVLASKELRLVVSRSYGPGRYDPVYEDRGIDYPAGYVRWTEGRNLEEVLRLMAVGSLRPSRLTMHTFDLQDGPSAYELLSGEEPSLGILLRYPGTPATGERTMTLERRRRPTRRDRVRIGVIGAGTFARGVLLPTLAREADVAAVATATGVSARAAAEHFGADLATTDAERVIGDDGIDAVVIATRHDSHAAYVERALAAGKHVFVEKPLALNETELARAERAAAGSEGLLMLGFNRRFAPLAIRLREHLADLGPLMISYRVNAGPVAADHWTRDPAVGGGRIVGEACHFVDLAMFLCGAPVVNVHSAAIGGGASPRDDNVAAVLRFKDGSVASLVYAALGDPSLAKERIEAMGHGAAGVLDDFRELRLHRGNKERVRRTKRDKGHAAELAAFIGACRSGKQPWPVEDMVAVTRTTFSIREDVRAITGAH